MEKRPCLVCRVACMYLTDQHSAMIDDASLPCGKSKDNPASLCIQQLLSECSLMQYLQVVAKMIMQKPAHIGMWYPILCSIQYIGRENWVTGFSAWYCLFPTDQSHPPVSKWPDEGVNDKLYGGLGGHQQSYFEVYFVQLSTCLVLVWRCKCRAQNQWSVTEWLDDRRTDCWVSAVPRSGGGSLVNTVQVTWKDRHCQQNKAQQNLDLMFLMIWFLQQNVQKSYSVLSVLFVKTTFPL